jgi:NAD-dependent deacetylase
VILLTSITDIINTVAKHIKEADKVVFFTGAGISVHSGVPDFRSPGGLWDKYDPYEVSTLRAFKKKPAKVWEFFRDLYENFGDTKPNAAHFCITEIQELFGVDKIHIVTQNIDGLHTKSGSKNVYEVHGNAEQMHCIKCSFEEELNEEKHLKVLPYPECPECSKPLKPKVVLFEELLEPSIMRAAMRLAVKSDIVIGIATSLGVFPASDIVLAPPPSTKKAIFNLTSTYYDHLIHYRVKGDVIETLPWLVEALKKEDT